MQLKFNILCIHFSLDCWAVFEVGIKSSTNEGNVNAKFGLPSVTKG